MIHKFKATTTQYRKIGEPEYYYLYYIDYTNDNHQHLFAVSYGSEMRVKSVDNLDLLADKYTRTDRDLREDGWVECNEKTVDIKFEIKGKPDDCVEFNKIFNFLHLTLSVSDAEEIVGDLKDIAGHFQKANMVIYSSWGAWG